LNPKLIVIKYLHLKKKKKNFIFLGKHEIFGKIKAKKYYLE